MMIFAILGVLAAFAGVGVYLAERVDRPLRRLDRAAADIVAAE